MCGIAGIFSLTLDRAARENFAREMAAKIAHRGRDGDGLWSGEQLTLAHRRLAVLDLSPAGAQPMHDREFSLVYNGEIYNCEILRKQLARNWRGHSDTEVLLAAFADWGVEKTLREIRGMFAGALWNNRERTLTLFRDRFGEKPLYYGAIDSARALVFASELRAFHALNFSPAINRRALAQFVGFGACRDCIWENFYKLPPASFVTFNLDHNFAFVNSPVAYWSARKIAASETRRLFAGTFNEAAQQLENLLRETVREQLRADVPIGVLLSGGIDSALIAALAADAAGTISTFTIGFADRDFDEAPAAKKIAATLPSEHHEIYVTDSDARNLVEKLPDIYDEPFADSSQLPTFWVCQAARARVTVALTGDGGDEIFGGYQRYLLGDNFWRYWRHAPNFLRRALKLGAAIPPRFGNWLAAGWPAKYPRRWGDKFQRLARAAAAQTFPEFYQRLLAVGDLRVLREPALFAEFAEILPENFSELTFAAQAKLNDQENYLPADLLVKIDRAAMANTLETRAPLLDFRIAELAWRLPLAWQIRGALGKIILREILYRYLPRELFGSQKKGFGVPLHRWLRGALRDWGESLLAENSFTDDDFFAPHIVRKLWDEHQAEIADHSATLWHVLIYQQWRRQKS